VACSAVFAGQLATTGVVGFRHWSAFCGPGNCDLSRVDVERPLSVLLAIAMFGAAILCLSLLLRMRSFTTDASVGLRVVAVTIGIVVAVGLPLFLGKGHPSTTDLTSLGGYALLYSLPWSVTIAATAWLRFIPAVAATGAAVVSSLTTALFDQHIAFIRHPAWFWLAALVSGCILLVRLLETRRDSSSQAAWRLQL
jgi:hypothetical protein